MEKVTGIGGVFFKARDADALRAWYRDRLGVPVEGWGGWAWSWRDAGDASRMGVTVWSCFKGDTKYFDPSPQPFMVNYRVANLDRMLAQLREAGCTVDDRVTEEENGRFGWVMDPEGNRIELWEPAPGM